MKQVYIVAVEIAEGIGPRYAIVADSKRQAIEKALKLYAAVSGDDAIPAAVKIEDGPLQLHEGNRRE